jgi:DNA-directed RNA polymerase specialized sigma subunit
VSRRTKRHPPLTKEQQNLVEDHRWIAGRLAHSAKCLVGGHTGSLTRDDMESVAFFALCVAAAQYKPEMGFKFSTYAWGKARGYIQHALRDYSRMVKTPRWIVNYKKRVDTLLSEGKTYEEVSVLLSISVDRVVMVEESDYNYHTSFDSRPDDWVTKEFVFDNDESKNTLISPELIGMIKGLSDAEVKIMEKFVDEKPMSDEEREWAADKFQELSAVAYGLTDGT